MSNFKVGDICYFKGRIPSSNDMKIFTLLKYVGYKEDYYPQDGKYWETDCQFHTNTDRIPNKATVSICPELLMRKLDNPGDEEQDEMIKITGSAPKVKEPEYAL